MALRDSLGGQGRGTGSGGNPTPSDLTATNTPAAGNIVTVATDTGKFTFAAPGGASIGNGSIDPIKLADISTGLSSRNKLIALANNGVDFALVDPFEISNGDITAAKLNITTGSGSANKLIGLNSAGTALELKDQFSISDGDITAAKLNITTGSGSANKLIGLDSNGNALELKDQFTLGSSEVDVSNLVIDGTLEAGKVLKLYSKAGGGFGLQVADDNQGSGGGGNVNLPLSLASASNFTGINPIIRGGTGASTAAAARANLGVAADGHDSGEDGILPLVTNLTAQPDNHTGYYSGTSADRPDTGSGGGLVVKADDGQYAVSTDGTDSGAGYIRSKTTTVDANWSAVGTPSPALPSVTTITQLRAVTNYTTVSSTFAAGNPQSTANSIITRIPTNHLGEGFFIAVPPGDLGFWATQIPSTTFNAADLSYSTWNTAPLPDEVNAIVHRNGAYDQIPAGRVGIVLDLVISSSVTVPVAIVHHDYDSDTTTSTYEARFYTTGTTVRESTRGHAHTAGSWVKYATDAIADGAVDADAIDNSIIITESDGSPVIRAKVPQLEDVELTGYTFVTVSNPAAGQVGYDTASRTLVVQAKAGDETLLDEIVARDFEFSIQKTSSGAAASVRGVFSSNPIELNGVLRATLRADDIITVGTLAANDTVKVTGHKAVYTKLDIIPPVGLGLGHGASSANHLVKFNQSGSAFTQGHLSADNLPTVLSDIRDISEHLTVEQMIRGRSFGTSYRYGATLANLVAGRFFWNDTTRELTIFPLAADTDLAPYLLPDVYFDLTSTNGAKISGEIEAVVNVSGQPTGSFSVRFRDHHSLYTGDIRSGDVSVVSRGAFVKRGDDVERIGDDAIGLSQLDIEGTQAANKWLRVNSTDTKLEFVDAPSGGGSSFPAAEYGSRAYSNYTRQSTLASIAAGQVYWDSTNARMTITPKSADTDLTTRLSNNSLVDFRGTGGVRLKGILTRIDNPTGTFPTGTFTIQFSTTETLYFKSSGFDASTAALAIHSLGKVASWNTESSTISGLFGTINREMLDTTNTAFNGAHLGVGTTIDSGDRRLVWMAPPAGGAVKHRMVLRQEIQGVGELSGVSTTRLPLGTQTGEWTMANRSSDWISFNSGGLVWFGAISAQPVCLDLRVWVRWKSGSEAYQSWNLSNSRVSEIDLGSDGLVVIKLFAGATPTYTNYTITDDGGTARSVTSVANTNTAHVDMGFATGIKTIKLSQMPTAITDGTDFQLNLGFMKQNPSPNFTARRCWLTADIIDGNSISANY